MHEFRKYTCAVWCANELGVGSERCGNHRKTSIIYQAPALVNIANGVVVCLPMWRQLHVGENKVSEGHFLPSCDFPDLRKHLGLPNLSDSRSKLK
ncbi:hypothetical protein GEV33_001073 [Tenebrio molitor]|uniref:Uncharacterized protein n=1 Tax=Tenebrio molitor TaxID=7067 RepID=A0A8J6HYD0_TENMO|nr:hypothetical protein GEV33_001073 [Tenebrio molitor]